MQRAFCVTYNTAMPYIYNKAVILLHFIRSYFYASYLNAAGLLDNFFQFL